MSDRAILPNQPSLDTFGGPKKNFGESILPESEVDMNEWNALAATAAAVAFSAPRAWAFVSAAGTLIAYGSVWGDAPGIYAPAPTKNTTGNYSITWPGMVPDLLDGTMRAFAPRATNVGVNTSGRIGNSRHSGQMVTVETYNVAGGAAADAAFTVLVF